jgi:hypothetical protein
MPLLRSRSLHLARPTRPGVKGTARAASASCFRRGLHGDVAVNRTAAGACTHACKPARLISPTSSQGGKDAVREKKRRSSTVLSLNPAVLTCGCCLCPWAIDGTSPAAGHCSTGNQSCVDGWSRPGFTRVCAKTAEERK